MEISEVQWFNSVITGVYGRLPQTELPLVFLDQTSSDLQLRWPPAFKKWNRAMEDIRFELQGNLPGAPQEEIFLDGNSLGRLHPELQDLTIHDYPELSMGKTDLELLALEPEVLAHFTILSIHLDNEILADVSTMAKSGIASLPAVKPKPMPEPEPESEEEEGE